MSGVTLARRFTASVYLAVRELSTVADFPLALRTLHMPRVRALKLHLGSALLAAVDNHYSIRRTRIVKGMARKQRRRRHRTCCGVSAEERT